MAAHPALHAAIRLREALEQSATALAEGRLDVLLAGEAVLQDASILSPASASRATSAALTPTDKLRLREELDAARRALARCRQLGANLTEFVRISFHAHGRTAGYEPQRTAAAVLGGRDLNMRA